MNQHVLSASDDAFTYPTNVDDLSGDWVRGALEAANPGLRITHATQERVVWGSATKVFFRIQYVPPGESRPREDQICIKGAFDDRLRTYVDLSVIFTTEAAFYRDIAPRLDFRLPRCWLAIENGVDGIVALEDLGSRGATFLEASDRCSPDQVAQILDILARLHSTGWGWKAGALPWITLGNSLHRDGYPRLMAEERFRKLTQRPEVRPFLLSELSDHRTVLAALAELWRQDDVSSSLCLSHGDAHLGQTYVEADGHCALLDWQCVCIMPWAKDVANYICSAMIVPDRRLFARDLVEHYLQELKNCGGPALNRDQAWNDFRKQVLGGMVWTVITEDMQPIESIATMCERYLAAIDDLKPLDALAS
jgi:Phosphotransferase enzyme family